jgi:serine/threonine-protein kinase HipA
LKPAAAKRIAGEVGRAVASWRGEASRLELPKQEIERMASAFEHDDLRAAVAAAG